MKKKTKSRLVNFLFFSVCIPVSLVFLWLFWQDLNRSSVRNDKTQIATIYFKRRIAQRKYSDRVVWERLAQSSPLYDEDTLKIAREAQARIKFKNNAELKIDENTMLQILTDKDGGIAINLSGGDVSIDTTSISDGTSVSLMLGGNEMKVSAGSKVTAAKNSSGENSFQIQDGTAEVQNSDGTSQTFETGSAIKIDSDGNISEKAICVTSIGKKSEILRFDENEKNSVTLKWITSGNQKNSPVRVETSSVPDFSEIIKTYDVPAGENSVGIENLEKNVYWRVFPLDDESEAESGKISVLDVSAVELLSPVQNPVFEYRRNLPKINFSWQGNEFASYYDFLVFQADDLSNPVFSQKVEGESVSLDSLEEGDYVWRVVPFYDVDGIGEGKSTENEKFYVARKNEVTPAKLVLPADNARILADDENSKISFAWKSDVDGAAFDFAISDSQDFSNPVFESQTESTKIVQNLAGLNLEEGKYFWKITRASNEDTAATRESEIRSFSIAVQKDDKTVAKLLYPPENFEVEKQKLPQISFAWRNPQNQNSQNDENSVIQFSRQSDFSSIDFEKNAAENQISQISLESGKWFWRVKNDENASAANLLSVLEKLKTPEILSPLDGSSMILGGSNLVPVKWKAEDENGRADFYKVTLSDNLGNKIAEKTLASQNRETSFELSNLETQNYKSFKISLQGFSDATEISQMRISDKSEINFSAKNPERLVLVSPARNAEIAGLSALRNPVNFSWRENDKITQNTSVLILRKQENNGSWATVRQIKNPQKQVQISNLSPGKYQWTVEAAGLNGINLSPESASYFSVLEIPHLAAPVLISPEKNLVMDASYLKRNRSIVFSWQKVQDATDYVFALYQKTENGGLKKITEQKTRGNTFRFRNLKNLDVADFVWRVTAYSHGRGGIEEQNSNTAENNFEIKFDLPKKIQTENPGTQYGE